MKTLEVVKNTEVKVEPFLWSDFSHNSGAEKAEVLLTKKTVKALAKKLGLSYTDEQIHFTKKIMTAYLAEK